MTDTSIDPGSDSTSNSTDIPDSAIGVPVTPGVEKESSADKLHRDKYNDPRANITRRGIWMGIGVVILGMVGAAASITARKTRLGETTRFWGQETVMALQLGERIELRPRGKSAFDPVELTATPGLGHLRRLLLDERNYDWPSEGPQDALQFCGQTAEDSDAKIQRCVQLRLTDPSGRRFEFVEIDIDLVDGWVGPSDGSRRVRLSERVQPKLRNYFPMIVNVQQKRYDHRD